MKAEKTDNTLGEAGRKARAAKTAKTKKGSNPVYDYFEKTTVGETKLQLRKNEKFTNETQVMACKYCTEACNNETEKIWATILLTSNASSLMKRHLIGTNPCEHCPEDVQKLLRASTKVFNKSK